MNESLRTTPGSRRALLHAAAGAAALAESALALGPRAAETATGNLQFGADNDAAGDATTLTSSAQGDATFFVGNSWDDPAAIALEGGSGLGFGVHGFTQSGYAVRGDAFTGTGVYASSTTGTALEVEGPSVFRGDARFDTAIVAKGRVSASKFGGAGGGHPSFAGSGSVAVQPGKLRVTVPVPGASRRSNVLAAFQSDPGAGVSVAHVNRTPGSIEVVFTAPATRRARLAYFVFR